MKTLRLRTCKITCTRLYKKEKQNQGDSKPVFFSVARFPPKSRVRNEHLRTSVSSHPHGSLIHKRKLLSGSFVICHPLKFFVQERHASPSKTRYLESMTYTSTYPDAQQVHHGCSWRSKAALHCCRAFKAFIYLLTKCGPRRFPWESC